MKFIIESYKDPWKYFWQQQLTYISEEHSFYMSSIVNKIDIEVIINKLSLTISDGIVVSLGGFCGFNQSVKSNYQVPDYKKGILKIEHNLKLGFAYGINDNDGYEYPVYINIQTGWVCVGDPEKPGNAVEFINNCVAVIDKEGNLTSLWLKPPSLPDL